MQFKQEIRYLRRNKLFSLVNILGLSISLTLVFLLMVFISSENSVDSYHKKKTYRLVRANECAFSPPFGQFLVDNIEGIESYCRVFVLDATLKSNENLLRTPNCYYTDSNFLEMFSVQLITGKQDEALNARNNVVISESFAHKLFPNSNPVGEIIRLNNRLDYRVTGVFKDFNQNTHFTPADVIFPFSAMGDYFNDVYLKQYDWRFFLPALYVTAKPGYDLSDKGASVYNKIESWYWLFQEDESNNVQFQPVEQAYFSPVSYGYVNGVRIGNPKLIRLFTFIVIGILVIAIINYINLTISYSVKRRCEVGVKKIIGSSRKRLIFQSLTETTIFFTASIIVGVFLFIAVLPEFNRLTGYQISASQALSVVNWNQLISCFILFFVLTGIITALVFSGFKPFETNLKTALGIKTKGFQNGMVVMQYTISTILIIAMVTIVKQNRFLINYDVGFDKEETFFIQLNSEIKPQKLAFKEELQKISGVESVSLCNGMPGVGIPVIRFEANNKTFNVDLLNIDEDYFHTMGIDVQNEILPNDNTCWINKSAADALNYNETQGTVDIVMDGRQQTYRVNEVLPDMNFHSLYQKGHPAIFTKLNTDGWVDYALVRVNTSDIQNVLINVEKLYKTFCVNFPFDFSFLDERINRAYEKEIRTANIVSWFSVFAILISSLGIFTLAVFTGNRRTKEIGIRKVNGATISEVMAMLNRDFIKWVAVAFVIATPIAYYAMHKWLENFAYKTGLSWWIFALAGLLALGIALLTVSWQSWKAATRNPVEALRYE
ncbi:MAG: ABC transporter permease [Mangrovibacterium sp.]